MAEEKKGDKKAGHGSSSSDSTPWIAVGIAALLIVNFLFLRSDAARVQETPTADDICEYPSSSGTTTSICRRLVVRFADNTTTEQRNEVNSILNRYQAIYVSRYDQLVEEYNQSSKEYRETHKDYLEGLKKEQSSLVREGTILIDGYVTDYTTRLKSELETKVYVIRVSYVAAPANVPTHTPTVSPTITPTTGQSFTPIPSSNISPTPIRVYY